MRGGVLGDSYLQEFCKEFRPFPIDRAPEVLKIDHPQSPYSGIKPIYNQTVVRPASINTMVANIHRANHKAGDVLSDHEELLAGVVEEVKPEAELAAQDVELPEAFRTPERLIPAFSSGRGGAREGSGRMSAEESSIRHMVEFGLPFREKITKKQVREAMAEGGEVVERLTARVTEESARKAVEGIMKRVERQIERKEKGK